MLLSLIVCKMIEQCVAVWALGCQLVGMPLTFFWFLTPLVNVLMFNIIYVWFNILTSNYIIMFIFLYVHQYDRYIIKIMDA